MKLKYCFLMIPFAGMKHGRRKGRTVRTVRRMLRLQRESRVLFVSSAAFSEWRRVVLTVVSGVKLHTRLRRRRRHSDSAFVPDQLRKREKRIRHMIQNIVMIVPSA